MCCLTCLGVQAGAGDAGGRAEAAGGDDRRELRAGLVGRKRRRRQLGHQRPDIHGRGEELLGSRCAPPCRSCRWAARSRSASRRAGRGSHASWPAQARRRTATSRSSSSRTTSCVAAGSTISCLSALAIPPGPTASSLSEGGLMRSSPPATSSAGTVTLARLMGLRSAAAPFARPMIAFTRGSGPNFQGSVAAAGGGERGDRPARVTDAGRRASRPRGPGEPAAERVDDGADVAHAVFDRAARRSGRCGCTATAARPGSPAATRGGTCAPPGC